MWYAPVMEGHDCSNARCRVRFSSLVRFLILVIFLCTLSDSIVAQHRDEKRVLLLFSEYAQRREYVEVLESSVRAHVRAADITFDEAYLEGPNHIDEKTYMDSEAETLRLRFAGVKVDLIVAAGPSALLFTQQYRETIFRGVPIVFTAVSSEQFEGKTWQGVTGVANHVGIGETIDLALHLQPDTTAVAVVSPYDPYWLAKTHAELSRYGRKVREIDFVGPPGPQLFEKVAALPPHTVVLFDLALVDSGQPPLVGFDLLDAVAQRIPTYSAWPGLCLNHGCIGGAFEDKTEVFRQTVDIAARVLSGETADKIPVARIAGLQVRVDSRALQHWHIPESSLPPNSLVLYREPTLWDQGRKYFLAAIVIIVSQGLLIFGLLWQRSRRRRTEAELKTSEEKFSKSFRQSPLAVTITSIEDARFIEVNEAFERYTGWKRNEVVGRTPFDIHLWEGSEQRVALREQLLATGKVRDLEFKVRTKDGRVLTGLGSAELIEVSGKQRVLSVAADITERKMAEEALTGVSRKLIEAQEAERTHIARELHDDINQRLAMLAINLKSVKQDLSFSEAKTSHRIEEACVQVSRLENDIQALSHRLHSSGLEYLGLEAAVTGFCRELSERQTLSIPVRFDGVPQTLPHEVSLCLFRVLQEAVHNAVKYSGVREFEVSLTGGANEIELSVHDSGIGFDPEAAGRRHGLGLTSMRERLRLVNGQLSVESKPQHGTIIRARVPLNATVPLDPRITTTTSAA
jgi:PAS domain S-box-containing protein